MVDHDTAANGVSYVDVVFIIVVIITTRDNHYYPK